MRQPQEAQAPGYCVELALDQVRYVVQLHREASAWEPPRAQAGSWRTQLVR